MNGKPRVLIDCNTFLQALAAPEGPAGRCVQLALDGSIDLFICLEMIEELREVASRPTVAAKLLLSTQRVDAFVESIELAGTLLQDFAKPFTYDRDPDDAMYVNLALAARASWIISRDKDLLDLTDPARPESREFRARFPSLGIVTPVQFLREIATHP